MIEPDVKEKILKDLDRMSPELQQRASELVHSLIEPLPKGGSIEDLIALQGTLDEDSAREMREAIEEGRQWIVPEGCFLRVVLSLSQESRAALVDQLLDSLDEKEVGQDLDEFEALWAQEAEDRLAAFNRGEIAGIPGEEVFASLKFRDNA